jgi:LuxR family maltose regulon positive regulatory protein
MSSRCPAATPATIDRGSDVTPLEGANPLGVPPDRHREWYHYHYLFRDLLGAELERREPELIRQLQARAAAWCEANGLPELAIDHAQAAEDADRVARLVECLAFPAYASGRAQTARRWFQWFAERGLTERYPLIALQGAFLQVLAGRPEGIERWAAAAERSAARTLTRATMEPWMALLRALLCRDGVDQMRADAEAATAGLASGSPWWATALLLQGIAVALAGESDRADPILATRPRSPPRSAPCPPPRPPWPSAPWSRSNATTGWTPRRSPTGPSRSPGPGSSTTTR